jgi:hypothetical protein
MVVKKLRASKRLEWDIQAQEYLTCDDSSYETAVRLIGLVRGFLSFYRPLQDDGKETLLCWILTRKKQGGLLVIG